MKLHGDDLKEGDVLMTNSPHAGGSQVLLISPRLPC
jgi:5-oxoprolinase (ATP-hydrolysing)